MSKILVVEDEQDLLSQISSSLTREHYTVDTAENGQEALDRLRIYKYDIIILDWLLPGLNGLDLCRRFRADGGRTPILMLTAKSSIEEKEAGLDAGADDYLAKPFHLKELSARIRALLRRPHLITGSVLTVGDLSLEVGTRRITKCGKEIHLEPKEFNLLEFFMRHPNQVFSAEALIERVWESETNAATDTIRTYIKSLRKKIDEPGADSLIKTMHGVGYKLEISSV